MSWAAIEKDGNAGVILPSWRGKYEYYSHNRQSEVADVSFCLYYGPNADIFFNENGNKKLLELSIDRTWSDMFQTTKMEKMKPKNLQIDLREKFGLNSLNH